MNSAFAATARAYRTAIRRHEWPDNPERIVRVILDFSYDQARYKALIPSQVLFSELCGKMSKGKISESLTWLEHAFVIRREQVPVSYGGRRRWWTLYTLLPPDNWVVSWRVPETARSRDVESWLVALDPEQPELIPPPQSLNDLLCEDFVERAGASLPGAGHGNPVAAPRVLGSSDCGSRVESASPSERTGSPERDFGEVESKSKAATPHANVSHVPMVPREGTKVETEAFEPSAKVPSGGTSSVPPQGTGFPAGEPLSSLGENRPGDRGDSNRSTRIDKSGTFNSNRLESNRTRARDPEVPRQGTLEDFLLDPYVREKLSKNSGLSRELVNGINLQGRHSLLKQQFGELYQSDPDQARELLAMALTRNHPNGWLNRSVRVGLGMERLPTGEA